MKKFLGLISFALSVCILFGLAAPAFAVNGSGVTGDPFIVDNIKISGFPKNTSGEVALGKIGPNFSNSYVTTKDQITSNEQEVNATKLFVIRENVFLTADLPTDIIGDGILTYKVVNGSKTVKGIEDTTGSGIAYNTLTVADGFVAPVEGYFGNVSGKVKPVGDVSLGNGNYTVEGASTGAAAKNVTIKGNASISGYIKTLTINTGATVTISKDTVIEKIVQKQGSKIIVGKDVTLTVGENIMQPEEEMTITNWTSKTNLLPAGTYTKASGLWVLAGNVIVKSTNVIIVDLEGNTITVNSGTVKAKGGDNDDDTGTVIGGEGGKASLVTVGAGVRAYGEFKDISMPELNSVSYPITVPAGETISAEYKDGENPAVKNSVTVKQDTVFEKWNGILPAGSNYKYENITGSWKSATTDTQTPIAVTYTGNGNSLEIEQDNAKVEGTFTKLDTKGHEVTVVGDLTVESGSVKLKGTEGVSLTIKSGEGNITGSFKNISLKGASAESEYNVYDINADTLIIENCKASVKGAFGNITVTDSVYTVKETTADSLTVVMSTLPTDFNTIQGTFKNISVTGDKYAIDVTGKPDLTVTGGEGTIKGDFKNIAVTNSKFNISEETTSADSLTVANSTVEDVCAINGSYKEIVVDAGKFNLNSKAEATLTVNDGDGTIAGKFYKLMIKGGSVIDDTGDTKVEIDHEISDVKESAVEVTGGTLTLRNNPKIIVNSDDTTAVNITGGTMTMTNGSVVAIGSDTKTVSVSNGGKLILGDSETNDDQMPYVTSYGQKSKAIYVSNNGHATIYRGSICFNDAESQGINVTYGGHVNIYPNDEFGTAHSQWQDDPHIHIYGSMNASAAMYINTDASFEIRGRGALIEEPYSDDGNSYALFIINGADTDASIIAGGTFNGKIKWASTDVSKSNLNHLIETNHYIRYDGSNIDFGWSDGTSGISPYPTSGDRPLIGGFNDNHVDADPSEFDGKYTDTVGKRGVYYSVIDAEHELRYAMANGADYQIPAGIIYQNNENVGMNTNIHRYGYAYDAIELDKNDPSKWGIDKRQGDVDVNGTSTLYLAGRRINYGVDYDYSDASLVSFNDGENDKLRTVALTKDDSSLTLVSAIYGKDGVDKKLSYKEGGFVSGGAISYKFGVNDYGPTDTSAIYVEKGELYITSGEAMCGESGIYAKGGKVVIGTASEDVSNEIILNHAKNQAVRVAGGNVIINGGLNYSAKDAILVESGTLSVKGGVVVGTNQYTGSGIHTTGGTATITGGAIYGNVNNNNDNPSAKSDESGRSIVIDGGIVNVAIDEAHQGYAEDFTRETAKLHHINNIVVNGGELNYDSAMNRNNGALTVTGGTVNYYDGVTAGETTVYGKEHTDSADTDFGTKFYVKDGDFGAFKVTGFLVNNENSTSYDVSSLRENVQLHGGYFTGTENNVLLKSGEATIEDILGSWKTAKYDGTNDEAKQVNHYVEEVASARNARGKWNRNNAIQSGTAYVGLQAVTAGEEKAISVRNAISEFKAWAAGKDNNTYKLYTNLWIGDAVCNDGFCNAKAEAPVDITRAEAVLKLNGLGIYGDKADKAILNVSGSAAVNGAADSEIKNLTGDAVTVNGELTLDEDAKINGKSAVTNNGTLTVNKAFVTGKTAIVNNGAATVNEGASITGTNSDGIKNAKTLTVNGGAISGKNGVSNTGTLTVTGGAVSGKNGVVNSGTFTLKDGTITGTDGDGITTSGTLTMENGTVTGTVDGVNKTAGTATLKAGTVSSIKTDGKISEILGAGLTLSDDNGVLAGADVLGRSSVKNGDNSGDAATGGDSVKYNGDTPTAVAYNEHLAANFTIAEKNFAEITLKANDKVTLTIENADKASLDAASVTNGTATIYLDKTGSAEIKVAPVEGSSISSVKVNDKALSNVAFKRSAAVKVTAKDSSVDAEGKPFDVIINSENGVTVTKGNTAYVYTVTGDALVKPVVQKMSNEGKWEYFDTATVEKVDGGYTVALGVTELDSDYRINAYKIHIAAPKTYEIVTEEAENGKLEASVESESAGNEVQLTATPDDGYLVGSVEVVDEDGNAVEVKTEGGKYVFTMPASKVTAKASFTKKVSRIFDDVSENDWFDPAVQYCYDNGLIKGTSEKLFSPSLDTTRGMIVTILYRVEKEPGVTTLASFTDVESGSWYAESVTWAQENGIVNGYPDGTFGAEDYITREQLAVILYNYAAYKGCDITAKADISAYADASEVGGWAKTAVEWANANGFINGYDNKLNPKGYATRAEAAAIIYRFLTSEIVK